MDDFPADQINTTDIRLRVESTKYALEYAVNLYGLDREYRVTFKEDITPHIHIYDNGTLIAHFWCTENWGVHNYPPLQHETY